MADDAEATRLALAWLVRLVPPDEAADIEAVSGVTLINRASRLLGPSPVRWAIDIGRVSAERIVREVPEFGGGGGQAVQTLRIGTESSTVLALLALAGDGDVTTVSPEALDGVIDFVRRGISLQSLLRGIRLGHAEISAAFLSGCVTLVDPLQRNDQIRYVSARLFEYIDNFAAALSERYAQEQIRWSTSSSAAKLELVQSILRSADISSAVASKTLGYDLTQNHLSIHVWSTARTTDMEGLQAQGVTTDVLTRVGATQRLSIPVGAGRVWSWCSTSERLDEVVSIIRSMDLPAEIDVAVGLPGRGIAGFRRTHREAVATFNLLQTARMPGPVVAYEEVDLISLLLADRTRAMEFVRRELGALAATTDQARDLRQTLLVYLDEQSSPHASAIRMHVARNTISYRVHRAEELMKRQVTDRRHQLHAALLVASVLIDLSESSS